MGYRLWAKNIKKFSDLSPNWATLSDGLSGEIGVFFNEAVAFSIADVFGWYEDLVNAIIKFCLYCCSTRHSEPLPIFCSKNKSNSFSGKFTNSFL